MKRTSLLAFALALGISASAGAQVQVTEHFDDDPTPRGWSGVDNRTAPQDYGFSMTDNTGADVNPPGGTATGGGEFGGTIARQNGTADGGKDNFYGVDINGEIDISTQGFTVKGVIHLQEPDGASGFYFGYSKGVASYSDPGDAGDARNFIGIQYDDSYRAIPIAYSQGGGRDRDLGVYDTGELNLVAAVTVPFSMIYDPNANGGNGSLAFEVNGTPHTWNMPGGVKNDIEPLTHFGIMPVSADGADAIIWLDDFEFTAYAAGLPGDVNGDGAVNIFDINLVSANWGNPGGAPIGDANGDGNVDIFDINLISANWTVPPPGGAAAVPEPTSAVLAALGLLGLVCAAGARSRRTTQR